MQTNRVFREAICYLLVVNANVMFIYLVQYNLLDNVSNYLTLIFHYWDACTTKKVL